MPTRSPHEEPPGPAAPAIPSFESLRSSRRRSAVDLLVPGASADSPAAIPAEELPPQPPAPSPQPPAPSPQPAGRTAPRPAEYGDLLRLGLRAARAVAGVPACVLHRLRSAVGG